MAFYTIKDINNIMFDGFRYELSQTVIDNIKQLERLVGVPIDNRKPPLNKPSSVPSSRSASVASSSSGQENWESLRSFKSTEKKVVDGIDKDLNTVRSAFNKISAKNYTAQFEVVLASLQHFIDAYVSPEMSWEDKSVNIGKLGKIIFDIISGTKNNSEINADLYCSLVNKFDLFSSILETFVQDFKVGIASIEYADPNKDYNLFCEYTKKNDMRKTAGLFMVALAKRGVLDKSELIGLLVHIQSHLCLVMDLDGKSNEVEELCDTLFTLTTAASNLLYRLEEWTPIQEWIADVTAKTPVLEHPSFTTRAKFKCLDILDNVKKSK
jgi:hypothetical protein